MQTYVISLILLSVTIEGFHLADFFEVPRNKTDFSTKNTPPEDYTESALSYSPYRSSTEEERNENTSSTIIASIDLSSGSRTLDSTTSTQNGSMKSSIAVDASTENSAAPMSQSSAMNSKGTTASKSVTSVTETNGTTQQQDGEKVVIGKPSLAENTNSTEGKSKLKTIYIKAVELISDTYTLSILIPVAAGIVFASSIILTVATCRCLRKRCRRNRMRRKVLPDSVKNLRPSDRARLLAESSDDEF